jgi:YegS/Rv2252/BmrU family lipid kinase
VSSTPLAIVNPKSGGGRTGRSLDELRRVMETALGKIDFAITERPRHAAEIAERAAKEGCETVIAVGGDGSIHEVVNGLMCAREAGASSTRLGVVGQGTGGDFRKTLGLEHRLDRYLSAIAGGVERRIDVGSFTYLSNDGDPKAKGYFVNILSAGMGGLVDRYVHDASGVLGGQAAYFIASARGLLESEIGRLKITTTLGGEERTTELDSRQISVCNGEYFGSGMHVAPMARPDDGVFEVVDLGASSKLGFLTFSRKIYDGSHVSHPNVKHLRGERVVVELLNERVRDKFLLDVDGEPLGKLPIDVRVEKAALAVLVPA